MERKYSHEISEEPTKYACILQITNFIINHLNTKSNLALTYPLTSMPRSRQTQIWTAVCGLKIMRLFLSSQSICRFCCFSARNLFYLVQNCGIIKFQIQVNSPIIIM